MKTWMTGLVILLGATCAACSGTTNLVPAGSPSAPDQIVQFRSGVGVTLRSFDGHEISGGKVIAPAGRHTVEFSVRRSWRQVWEYLDGVESVGECMLSLDGAAGDSYRVATRISTTQRRPGSAGSSMDSIMTDVAVLVVLEDLSTRKEMIIDCPLRLDCLGLDRSIISPSSGCTYGNPANGR